MSVAIVGRGQLGRAVEHALSTRGVRSRLVSRSTGFDVTAPGLQVDLGPVDVVVEATDIFTTRKEVATGFFTQSTRAVGAAARSAGARHLLVSVVGLGQPGIQRYGYFAAKAEQERVARRESTDLTVVRSTQWFEFAQQSLERMRLGPLAVVPAMTLRPVALEAVADVVAECVVGERAGTSYDVAGPEVLTLWEMTRALPRRAAVLVPVRLPGPARPCVPRRRHGDGRRGGTGRPPLRRLARGAQGVSPAPAASASRPIETNPRNATWPAIGGPSLVLNVWS